MANQDPRLTTTATKTEARQGRIIGQGRIARMLLISLVLLGVLAIVVFYIW